MSKSRTRAKAETGTKNNGEKAEANHKAKGNSRDQSKKGAKIGPTSAPKTVNKEQLNQKAEVVTEMREGKRVNNRERMEEMSKAASGEVGEKVKETLANILAKQTEILQRWDKYQKGGELSDSEV